MRIELRLFATLRRFVPTAEGDALFVDIPEGGTAGDVIAKVGVNAAEVHILMVNGRSSPFGQILAEGDRVGLFPAIGGG